MTMLRDLQEAQPRECNGDSMHKAQSAVHTKSEALSPARQLIVDAVEHLQVSRLIVCQSA